MSLNILSLLIKPTKHIKRYRFTYGFQKLNTSLLDMQSIYNADCCRLFFTKYIYIYVIKYVRFYKKPI